MNRVPKIGEHLYDAWHAAQNLDFRVPGINIRDFVVDLEGDHVDLNLERFQKRVDGAMKCVRQDLEAVQPLISKF